jgi:arginine utilization regulatory protein
MDLFYRLGVIYIKLPALRDRRPDIEELGRHFLQKYNTQLGKSLQNIAPEVIDFFWQYPWPGNVRELEHVIESAVNFAGRDETRLKLEHCYFANILEQDPPHSPSPDPTPADDSHQPESSALPANLDLCTALKTLEKKMIIQALEQSSGNVAGAARRLGISRQLLGSKISRLRLRHFLAEIKHKNM